MRTQTDSDLTILEHLDFEVPCESRWHLPQTIPFIGADRPPARWRIVMRYPCGTVCDVLACEQCRDLALTYESKAVACTVGCGESHRGSYRDFLASLTRLPLGGAA